MAEIERMIAEAKADRRWFLDKNLRIEAAACVIREKALNDAKAAILRDKK